MASWKVLGGMLLLIGSAVAQPAKSGPDSCGVLSKAEVQEAVGAPVAEGTPNKTNKMVCEYLVTGKSASMVSVLLTTRRPMENAATVAAALNKRKPTATVVPGIGEGAYTSSGPMGIQQYGAFKGPHHVVVTVMMMGGPEAKSKEIAEKAIRKAVSKL